MCVVGGGEIGVADTGGGQIITLLDLRQRQATTENAISSGKQSALLFAQSKVLFVFTAATVIFVSFTKAWVCL